MKILNIVHNSQIDTGGKISHNLLMKELKERGHEIHFLSTEKYNGFQTHLMPDYMQVPVLELREKLVQKQIEKTLSQEEFDYVYSSGCYSTYSTIKATKNFSTKSIIHFRDYWFDDVNGTYVGDDGVYYRKNSLRNIIMHNKKSRILWNLYKHRYLDSRQKLLDKANFIISTSSSVEEKLEQIGVKSQSLPNPVNVDSYLTDDETVETDLKSPIVTFIGSLKQIKGTELLSDIIRSFSETSFLIVGEGRDKEKMQAKFSNRSNVKFTGWIDKEQIPAFYNTSDIILYPSLVPEGFGRIAVEAMASATPIISSNRGGMRDIITDGKDGILLDPENTKVWKESLEHLLESEELRTRMGEEGRKNSSQYSVKNHVEKFLKVIE